MTTPEKIPGTIDNWDVDGPLGKDEQYAKVTTDFTVEDVQDSLGLKPVSIRMQESVLSDLKVIAKYHGIGYQPLIKQILKRFVDSEFRQIVCKQVDDKNNDCDSDDAPGEPPKAASA